MRDYKNVKVPRSYRPNAKRVSVKHVQVGRSPHRSGAGMAGFRSAALQVLMAVLTAAGVWLGWELYQTVTHAEMFQIAGVDVNGVKQITEPELKGIADIFTRQNIFQVDLDGAVRRARANPWVKDVRIFRRLPNRISMAFVERTPIAVLETGAGRFLLDGEGTVIIRIGREDGAQWPLPVIAMKDERARPGEPIASNVMAEALTLLNELSSRGGWRMADVTIRANTAESLTIAYADHEFRIGSGNYAEKLRRLTEVMADVKQRAIEITSVDLRPERQAAVMVKNSRVQGTGARGKKRT